MMIRISVLLVMGTFSLYHWGAQISMQEISLLQGGTYGITGMTTTRITKRI